MHLPHAVQQCPSCYMYCMSRGASSVGGPPIPPHANGPGTQHGQQEASGGSPQRTQPRAVTLPHIYQCSHQDQMGGPRPRFGSLPHQQQSPKLNMPNHATLQHQHPLIRATALSHNVVGLPEECPPPLPPHGPPPLPPANLISKNHPQQVLRGPSPPFPKASSAQDEAHYNVPGRMPNPGKLNGPMHLQASFPPPVQMIQPPLYGSTSMHASTGHEVPSRCPNPQIIHQMASGQDRKHIIPCGAQHAHDPKCNTMSSSQHKEAHPHVPHPRSYPQGGPYPSHPNDTPINSQSIPHPQQYPPKSSHPNTQSGLQNNEGNTSSTPPQGSQKHPPTSVPCQYPPPGPMYQHPPHTQGSSKTLSHIPCNSHNQQSCAHPHPRQFVPHSQSGSINASHVDLNQQGLSNPKDASHPHSQINSQHHEHGGTQPRPQSCSHPMPILSQNSSHPKLQGNLQPPSQNNSYPQSLDSSKSLKKGNPNTQPSCLLSQPHTKSVPHNAPYCHPPLQGSNQFPQYSQMGPHTLPHPHENTNHQIRSLNSNASSSYSQIQTQGTLRPQLHPQCGPHPHPQTQTGMHPHPQTQGVPHPQTQGVPHPQTQGVPHPHPQTQGVSHPHPQTQAGMHPHPQTQGVLHPHPQTQGVPHPHPQTQCVPHPHPQGVPHPQTQGVPHSQTQGVPHPQTQGGVHPHTQSISRPQLHPQNGMYSANASRPHIQKEHHVNFPTQVSQVTHPNNVAANKSGSSLPKAGILKKTAMGPNSVGNCNPKMCSHDEVDNCYSEKQYLINHPHLPKCAMVHAHPHAQKHPNDLHHHHQCPSCSSLAGDHQGMIGGSIMRAANVPPPPPMPPPPNIPPPMSFGPFQYDCLPHQHLVPPPLQQDMVLGCPEHGHHHVSSAAKVDRPYCGSGPPGRNRGVCVSLNKNHGIDVGGRLIQNHHHGPITNGNHHQLGRRHQAVSQSAVMGSSRHGLRGVAVDDCGSRDRWRRNGGQREGQSYELSQDLADKRLEMLERRYGGDRARRAATTIQRAYRHYAMHKKFRAITATAKAQEKRLSRRFTVDASNDWAADSANTNGHPFDAEQRIRSEFDKLNRNLNATVYGENRRPSRSLSMRDSSRGATSPRIEVETLNDTSLYCHSSHNTNTATTTTSPPSTPVTNGSENNHQHFSNDSNNSYASSRELKYLTSEDSGFGSQEPVINKGTSSHRSKSSGKGSGKKVPPEVPRRTSSIKSESSGSADSFVTYTHRVHCAPPSLTPPSSHSSEGGSDRGALRRSADNGSLSSVQSSGSDSSLSQSNSDRGTPLSNQEQQEVQEFVAPTSPVWKRKAQLQTSHGELQYDDKRLSNISENSEDSCQSNSSEGVTYSHYPHGTHNSRHARLPHHQPSFNTHEYKISEVLRKRQYRVGLNLFNKKPERGITYLIGRGFLENSSQAVAKFLLTRKGLSKQMIGEYLGNLQNQFNMSVLESFATEIDLSGVQVDVALRKFQTLFRMPGEAQKIERLMQVFAQRYCQCNRDIVSKLHDPETIFVLAFAIIMLNTDLHTASLKPEKRMKIEDFVKNLRGIDDGFDIEREMLEGMYQRIKDQEFRPGNDHVTQVLKVQQTVVGKKPVLALPHRRLVCYCRLYEIPDPNKKERSGLHQREVFLFNDLLVVTKIFSKKKNSITYTFRESFPLAGLQIQAKETLHYPYLLEVRQRVDNKVLIMLNARNEHDRTKFCEDLRESILEMDEMENLRIEGELERQKANLRASRPNSTAENRDSGVADMELITPGEKSCSLKPEGSLKRTTLSNSLLDIHEAGL